jgi:hypothetical protein
VGSRFKALFLHFRQPLSIFEVQIESSNVSKNIAGRYFGDFSFLWARPTTFQKSGTTSDFSRLGVHGHVAKLADLPAVKGSLASNEIVSQIG